MGKRTQRERIPSQVNVDSELSEAIRIRAIRSRRTVGSEIVHLLTVGVVNDPEETVYEHFRSNAHVMAPPRTVTHISPQAVNVTVKRRIA